MKADLRTKRCITKVNIENLDRCGYFPLEVDAAIIFPKKNNTKSN